MSGHGSALYGPGKGGRDGDRQPVRSNETVGKDTYRKDLIASTSARLLCGYVYASAGDGESTQDLVFSGHHMIAENGSVLAEAARFENETIFRSWICTKSVMNGAG